MSKSPQNILTYNPTHRILICRECQYAIQKSAVSSHLLRHKIYREERQRLVAYSARLDVPEPEDVPTPRPRTPAVDGLPVIAGHCCTRDACGKLCASLKRMKKHLSEAHSDGDGSNSVCMRPVMMQTFFRGTKIRYFEVSTDFTDGNCGDAPTGPDDGDVFMTMLDNLGKGCGDSNDSVQPADSSRPIFPSHDPSVQLTSTRRILDLPSIDLGILGYFHHYTTVASSGLSVVQQEPHFWQVTAVQQALQHEWLMWGLLAISTCHLAMSATARDDKQQHLEQLPRFRLNFSAHVIQSEGLMVISASESERSALLRTSERIGCILRCAQWSLDTSTLGSNDNLSPEDTFKLHSFVITLRRLAQLSNAPPSLEPEATFSWAKESLENEKTVANPTYNDLRTRVRILPNEFSNIFGRPSRVQDVLATLSATARLVVQCDVTFTCDTVGVVWRGMVGWLTTLSEHFDEMLNRNDPAALVLMAYWANLVKRAEDCGLWWLKGLAEEVVREADQLLDLANSDLRRLVQQLDVRGEGSEVAGDVNQSVTTM